jgi:hypothetical protein
MMSAMEMFNKAIGMTSDETGVAVSEYGRYIKNIPR